VKERRKKGKGVSNVSNLSRLLKTGKKEPKEGTPVAAKAVNTKRAKQIRVPDKKAKDHDTRGEGHCRFKPSEQGLSLVLCPQAEGKTKREEKSRVKRKQTLDQMYYGTQGGGGKRKGRKYLEFDDARKLGRVSTSEDNLMGERKNMHPVKGGRSERLPRFGRSWKNLKFED